MYDTDFDLQKLMFHPREVGFWLENGCSRGPLYTEMELSRGCNCRCIFCGVDYQVNKAAECISLDDAKKIITSLNNLGNKSIMFCGHGEPLLNPDARQIIHFAAEKQSCSMTTNGLALTGEKLPLIDDLAWIRFSINGGDPDNYIQVHGTDQSAFNRVIDNISAAVARKRSLSLPVTIGTQMVLLEENIAFAPRLARHLRDIGVDYFSIKPYSHHPLSEHDINVDYHTMDLQTLETELASLTTDNFKIIFRSASMAKVGVVKQYRKCYGTDFLCFVSANGDLWECNIFAGDKRFFIGNGISGNTTAHWRGPLRQKVLAFIADDLNLGQCRDICRMDECNRYLWRLKNPMAHDDFI